MRCVVCGREIEHGYGYLCGKCMAEREEVVRVEPFEILICSKCGSIKTGNRWIAKNLREVIEKQVLKNALVAEEFEVSNVAIDYNSKQVTFAGRIAGDYVEVTAPLKYSTTKMSCPKCSREAGGYYESIVQVRAENRELSEEEIEITIRIVEEVLEKEKENEKAFVSKMVMNKGGIDIYFGSRNIGMKVSRMISREFGGEIKESKKLHTRMDGRDIYRFTYLVRLPEYRCGDIVKCGDKMYIVKNVKNKKGVDIITGKTINIDKNVVAVRREELTDGVVVNADENVVEVVCDDGSVVVAERPFGVEIGSEVKIFEYSGKYYALRL